MHLQSGHRVAIDAASEFYADGAYNFEGNPQTAGQMTAVYAEWLDAYPVVSIEDPLAEEDWPGWQQQAGSFKVRGATSRSPGRRAPNEPAA